jgi:hypothetical protein
MFNLFQSQPFTTYYDVSTGQVLTVPNSEYRRQLWQLKGELEPFSSAILIPKVSQQHRLEFDQVTPQTGIQLYRQVNLEALLANLCLLRTFVVTEMPKLLQAAYKPPVVSLEDKLREVGYQLREQLALVTQDYTQLAKDYDELLARNCELESLLGDKWADIKTIIAKFAEVNISVRFLESYSEADSHVFVFKNVGLQVDDSKLKRVADSMPGLLNWVTNPPSYEVSKGEIVLEFDTRDIEQKLDAVQQEWLPTLAQCEENLMVFGARGSGKTSLVNNYVAVTLNQIPDAQVEYLQPKPESDTPLGLVPTAIGFDECFARHSWLMGEYMRRNEANMAAIKANQPMPHFDPIFAIYEELQTMVMKHPNPKVFCKEIETAVSFGRTLGLNFLCTAQVASIRNFPGWTKASLTQYNRLYIGEAIKTAIDYAPTLEDKKAIREQYALYRASNRQFYGLLMRPNGLTMVYDLPLPNSYQFDTETTTRFLVQCKRRNFDGHLALNPHLRDMVTGGVLQCPSCNSTKWIPSKYTNAPGTKVVLRCYASDCSTKLNFNQ